MIATAGFTVGYDKSSKFKATVDSFLPRTGPDGWQEIEDNMTVRTIGNGIACTTRGDLIELIFAMIYTPIGDSVLKSLIDESKCEPVDGAKVDKAHKLVSLGTAGDGVIVTIIKNGKKYWAVYVIKSGTPNGQKQRGQTAGRGLPKWSASEARRRYQRGI
jgi:hypothetical protein